jgi:hypothetical protein
MPTQKQTPIEIFRKLARDPEATAAAQVAQARFGRAYAAFAEMQSFDFLLLAQIRHPNATPRTAVALMGEEVDALVATVKEMRADFNRTRVSEFKRLAQVDAIVLRRESQLDAMIQHAANVRTSALNQIERDSEKVQKLKDAGLNQEQIELTAELALKPDEIEQIYKASVKPLMHERDLIAAYRRTLDETKLPETIQAHVREAQAEAVQ